MLPCRRACRRVKGKVWRFVQHDATVEIRAQGDGEKDARGYFRQFTSRQERAALFPMMSRRTAPYPLLAAEGASDGERVVARRHEILRYDRDRRLNERERDRSSTELYTNSRAFSVII
eukprot:3819366-Pleurochrysis_carterae.AAC.4